MDSMSLDLSGLLSSKNLDKKLTEKHIVVLIYNMLCSLNFIHSAGILHRDIKMENILVDENCDIKICDFGLSRRCLAESQKIKLAPI